MEKERLPEKREREEVIYYQEDEIDLYELWLTLKKRWKVVLSTTALFVLASVVYILVAKPVYEIKTYIQTMYLGGDIGVKPEKVKVELEIRYVLQSNEEENEFLSKYNAYLDKVELVEGKREQTSDTIKLTIISENNKNGISYSNHILKQINEEYAPFLKNFINSKEKEILDTKSKIKNLKSDIEQLKLRKNFILKQEIPNLKEKIRFNRERVKKIDELILNYRKAVLNYQKTIKNLSFSLKNSNLSESSSLLLISQISQYENLISSLEKRIKELEVEKDRIIRETIPSIEKKLTELSTLKIEEINKSITEKENQIQVLKKDIENLTTLISPPLTKNFEMLRVVTKDSPAKPKKSLILAVATVSGLFLGVFLAFFLEWIENARKRHTQTY
ncbi:hypothetical protein GWK41_09840 [Persephonella atlantica]|uniref:Polysaccharide chain length determinant N-terminal domain-containing protein n=1 Tax=Persephonella atlantica TaxID=2699429 RepID=A0ABS1GKB4_9AQUI|nr:Wzz/FepE/Etk N-terminal domain-containing protein [Persephonella atlantica]MBK3333368.1 hypothetical protein [Persephonella atlantica]